MPRAEHVVVRFVEARHGAAPGKIDCAIASRQGILDEATVPDRDNSVADHTEGFNLWLRGIHRHNCPVPHE